MRQTVKETVGRCHSSTATSGLSDTIRHFVLNTTLALNVAALN